MKNYKEFTYIKIFANKIVLLSVWSSNMSHAMTYTFGLIPLEKVWTPLSPSNGLNNTLTVLQQNGFGIR